MVKFINGKFYEVFGKPSASFLNKLFIANPRKIGGAKINQHYYNQMSSAARQKVDEILSFAVDNNMTKKEWIETFIDKW